MKHYRPLTRHSRALLGSGLSLLALLAFATFQPKTESASLTSASVTLSNPRLSFRGSLDAGNSIGSTVLLIKTAGAHPSLSTNQLVQGDTVRIGDGNSLAAHTVSSTNPNPEFTITAGLASGDADEDDDVIASQSATHTVRFTTANAIANGAFRVLVPSLDSDADSTDGIPDGDFFDFGNSAPTVTCPSNATATYDFVTGTATASTIDVGGTEYHSFECAYSGTGAVSTDFDGSSNDAIVIDSLINPAPESGHTAGTANSHQIIIQHLDSSYSVQDSVSVAVGVIEAVKVTATVDPTINFTIAGVSSSTSTCGTTTGVTTTAVAVPFGSLSLSAFIDAAQTLTVSTNGTGGYSVTALANDQLGLNGAACSGDNTGVDCIRDSAGDNAAMTHAASDEWDTTSNKGFGYSMENDDAAAIVFEYDTSSGNCSGTFCARQFADEEDSQTAVQLFSSTTTADSENVDVCYRIIPAITNSAGDYENYIKYTATATF